MRVKSWGPLGWLAVDQSNAGHAQLRAPHPAPGSRGRPPLHKAGQRSGTSPIAVDPDTQYPRLRGGPAAAPLAKSAVPLPGDLDNRSRSPPWKVTPSSAGHCAHRPADGKPATRVPRKGSPLSTAFRHFGRLWQVAVDQPRGNLGGTVAWLARLSWRMLGSEDITVTPNDQRRLSSPHRPQQLPRRHLRACPPTNRASGGGAVQGCGGVTRSPGPIMRSLRHIPGEDGLVPRRRNSRAKAGELKSPRGYQPQREIIPASTASPEGAGRRR